MIVKKKETAIKILRDSETVRQRDNGTERQRDGNTERESETAIKIEREKERQQ